MIVDWSKYKRFFTFGCSFTCYMWPTWADVISKEMPDVEFYNFGVSGSGNTLISYRIAEANNRYKFTDTDLVMVMFTSYCREDRWIDSEKSSAINAPGPGWLTVGNVFNNSYYPSSFVRDFADERGYLIRDAAVIDMTTKYLKTLPATSYCMLSVPFVTGADAADSRSRTPDDIRAIYEETFNSFKPSMHELEIRSNWKILEHDYKFKDGHPSPKRYHSYLKKLGFNLTDKSEEYANKTSDILADIEVRNIVPVYFPEQDEQVNKSRTLLF